MKKIILSFVIILLANLQTQVTFSNEDVRASKRTDKSVSVSNNNKKSTLPKKSTNTKKRAQNREKSYKFSFLICVCIVVGCLFIYGVMPMIQEKRARDIKNHKIRKALLYFQIPSVSKEAFRETYTQDKLNEKYLNTQKEINKFYKKHSSYQNRLSELNEHYNLLKSMLPEAEPEAEKES